MLSLQRRGIVDEYRQFSFSRASTAFDSRGRLCLPHNARFETVDWRTGVLVEEWTANIISGNPSFETGDFSNWSIYQSYGGATYEVTAEKAWHGSYAAKIVTDGTASGPPSIESGKYNVNPDKQYTFQVRLAGDFADNEVYLAIRWRDSSGSFIRDDIQYLPSLTNSFRVYTMTVTAPSNAATAAAMVRIKNTAVGTVYIDAAQLEEKSYATSWIPGGTTRSSEKLTAPTAGILQPQAGTIEFWAYVDAKVRDTSQIRRFVSHNPGPGNANRITIQHNNTPHWVFTIGDNAGNTHSLSVSDSYTPDGWHYFAMVWDATRFAVFIDGVKRGEVLNPTYLPQTLAPTFDIGHSSGSNQPNTLIANLRISNKARSDTEISNAYSSGQPLQADQYTTLLLNFDGPDAQRAAKTVVI